jgi:glyoxylase-like metal-dependent hydrolase (beta-lactamase superfamily II)
MLSVPSAEELIAPGVRRLVANNPGLMTGDGTNTYLLGEREIAVLDPGPEDARHLERIRASAGGPIRWVLVTHTHRDHSPLARALARASGARVLGWPPPADGRQDEHFVPDEVPRDGARLTLGDITLTAIHTPGHASNCVCYLLERERLLFTGDHVLGGVSPVILHPDGDMGAYLASLEKLATLDFERIAPGHGAVLPAGKRVLAALRAHRLAREAKVLAALGAGPAALDELTTRVYDDVPVERHPWARLTLEAHLIKLERERRVLRSGERWQAL